MGAAYGIDFGTTNSAIASAEGPHVALARHGRQELPVFRSILYFEPPDAPGGAPRAHAGPAAIEGYLAGGGRGRLMQSLKSFLGSRSLVATSIFGRSYTLEQLIAVVLRDLRMAAEAQLGMKEGERIVAGRPVRFAWAETEADDRAAEARLRNAYALAGFPDVVFEYEPVGAAHRYEEGLDHDELVLVGDFGGGTSDFCLLRVGPGARRGGGRILGSDGVGVGGDTFDAAIVDELVSPELGRGAEHRSHLGKELPNPTWIYGYLKRWHHLSVLKSAENRELLRSLQRQAHDPEKIARLIALVERDLGYALYGSVERAKVAVSSEEEAPFRFREAELSIEARLPRAAFEEWISEDLAAVSATVERLLDRAAVAAGDVDRVFVTGGSALVPAVRRLLAARFGEARIATGDFLLSVASGLALRAREC